MQLIITLPESGSRNPFSNQVNSLIMSHLLNIGGKVRGRNPFSNQVNSLNIYKMIVDKYGISSRNPFSNQVNSLLH